MGKQYNKVEKRQRRKLQIKRKNAAVKARITAAKKAA